MNDLVSVPVKVTWDPRILRLEMAAPGGLLTEDGKVAAPSLDIRNDSGEATIEVNRLAGAEGVNGAGALIRFTFTAVGQGNTRVALSEANLKNSKQQPIRVTAPAVAVTVQ